MGRQGSMAAISAALQGGTAAPPPVGGNSAPPVAAPHAAPGVSAPTPLTADEKRGYDAARQDRLDAESKQNDIIARQEQDLQHEQEEEQAREDLFAKTASDTTTAISGIVKGTGVQIERLPTPGSLVLPLVILLVFFFLLLPVNGHTRFVWIWLTLIGNAEIGDSGFAGNSNVNGSSGNFATTPPASSGGQIAGSGNFAPPGITPLFPAIIQGITGLSYTGVEDLNV